MLHLRRPIKNTAGSFSILSRCFSSHNLNIKPFPDDPTPAYYDDEVSNAGHSRDFDRLVLLLNKRIRDGCYNTRNTFKFITNNEASLSVLDDLISSLSRLDRGFTRKSAYDSLISRLCKLNRIDESLQVVDAMASGGCNLNAAIFHPILNVLTKKKEMDDAWRAVDLMRLLQVTPDVTSYNYFLMAYGAVGDLNGSVRVLKMIDEQKGMKADTRTYDALVLGACKAGKVEGALALLRRMADDGVPVLLSTHIYVIRSLLEMGYYQQAVTFVMCYAGMDEWLDRESFGCLASRLIRLKRTEETKMVLEEMHKRGLEMGQQLKKFYFENVKMNKVGDVLI